MDPRKRNVNSSRETLGVSNMVLGKSLHHTPRRNYGLLCAQKTKTLAYYTKQNLVQNEVKRVNGDSLPLWYKL